jgi:hypothetical protein
MPKRRYEQREPTHDWQQIQPLLKDPAQIQYEILRPVVLWGVNFEIKLLISWQLSC